ncbi:MAG: DUF86 domain-containing protein [Candidatus Micrarchaeota archaeon]
MNARIRDKITEIEEHLTELEEILPRDFEEYSSNFEKKAACERYFEKIIEAVVDLAFLIIKDVHLKPPEEDKQAFDILTEAKIITPELSERLKNAKGMRNIIAHDYGSVDDELVFHAVANELEKDVKEFVAKARRGLQKS